MIEKTLLDNRNFLLDTGRLAFLTFHNSRKVRRIYKDRSESNVREDRVASMTFEVFCGHALIAFDQRFRFVAISHLQISGCRCWQCG
jgi:hypothetical protein